MSTRDATTWNRLASRYDRVIPFFSSRYGAASARLRRDLAGASRVLEVGAGTGQFTFELAAVAERVVATDVAPEMVARLRRRVAASGVGNVEVRAMSADAIDYDDGAFDALVGANVLHVMEQPSRAMGQFARVLCDRGLLLAPTFCHGQHVLARTASRLLSLVSPFAAHTRFSVGSLREFIQASGFDVETVDNLGGWLPLVYVRGRKRTGVPGQVPAVRPTARAARFSA